ncbi:MAG: hypothetical protein E7653_00105 [Ruminococcaceae bacterium]|nr:hypothetical protein [Oscillospiraceae bacterium]
MEEKRERILALLKEYHLKQQWLIFELAKLGKKVAHNELTEMLHGRRAGPKAQEIVDVSLSILERYGAVYVKGA